jgi:glycosyltransferase involved in cell wall biosynthesis
MPRVAIVASHPIQYQAPWFRALSRSLDIEVFFCHRQDAGAQAAAGFGEPFDWDVPLLEGYDHRWLTNVARTPSVDRFGGCDTPGIRDALASGRFDACIVSGWYLRSYVQAIRACAELGIPVVSRGDSQLAGPRSRMKRAAKYLPYRWLLQRIDAHLYVGTANRAYLEHYGVRPERLFFAPHCVDTEWFRSGAHAARETGRTEALRAALGLDAGGRVALFAGKFIEKKRPADFVSAVARLRRDGRPVQGVMIGDGPLRAELEAQARAEGAAVIFMGFRNQSDMPACYTLAEVLVLPSDGRETWGLVANEAMACGVPVVLSQDVGAAADLTDGVAAGFAYPCGDVPALAAAIDAALEAVRARPGAVQAAIRGKLEEFSLARAIRGTTEAIAWVRARREEAADA